MANVDVILSVQILDALGVTATLPLFGHAADTVTLAQLATAGATALGDIDALTDGAITGAHVRVALDTSGFGTPAADSEVEKGGLLNFGQGGSPYKQGYWIPALKDSLITNGKIDLAAGAVTAFVTLLTASGGTIDYTGKFGNLLTRLIDALISFRKHRRAENRRSSEIAT